MVRMPIGYAIYTLLVVFNLRNMIKEIEIKGAGKFEIKHDLMHRGNRPRLKTFDKGIYKEVSFNSFIDYLEPIYQLGYDYNGNEIQIRIVN